VTDHLKAGGPSYVYRLEIAPVEASLTMVLPERVQYVPVTLAVPRGNRMALMINASRANWGGDLNVNVEGLPQGITLQTIPMTADKTSVPVLFTAAADAPLNGTLADVVGRPADANLKFVGHLAQRTMLVARDNNRDVWGHDADRLAASVIDEMPFQIEIECPRRRFVRQGSKSLKSWPNARKVSPSRSRSACCTIRRESGPRFHFYSGRQERGAHPAHGQSVGRLGGLADHRDRYGNRRQWSDRGGHADGDADHRRGVL